MINRQHLEEIVPTLQGWCSVDKAWRMVELCIERKPKIIVESGIFGGRSLLPLGFVSRDIGAIVYGIDPWSVDAANEGNESDEAHKEWWSENGKLNQIYREFVEQIKKWDLWEHVIWLRMKGSQGSRIFDDGEIDFFHLDSNHSEKVSCEEVERWGPKMAQKSVIIFDDVSWPTQQKALKMIKDLGFVEIFNDGNYWIGERK